MLETLLSSILIPYLEEYVENFDRNRLNIGLLKGVVSLKDITLKPYALDSVHPNMPVVISNSYLGKLTLNIPWTSLRSSPVTCEINDVFLVLTPKRDVPYNAKEENDRKEERKKRELERYESNKVTKSIAKKDLKKESEDGFVDKLIETIVNNIQITIRNIHIRYEDASTCHRTPITVGCFLDSIIIKSTDQDWKTSFMKEIQDMAFKLFEMKNLALYMNTNVYPKSDFISYTANRIQANMRMHKLIQDKNQQFLLKPMNGELKLTMQKISRNMDLTKPQFNADFSFSDLVFTINDKQYKNIFSLVEYFTTYPTMTKYMHKRPTVPISQNAKLWWIYAYESVKDDLIRSREETVKQREKQKAKDKQLYVLLYKMFIGVPWLQSMTADQTTKFAEIEARNEVEDLIYFRKLANAEIKEEEKQHEAWKMKKSGSQKNWFGWRHGIQSAEADKVPPGVIKITEEVRKELYESVGYDTSTPSVKFDQEYIKMKLRFNMNKADFIMEQSATKTPIVRAAFEDLCTDWELLEGRFKLLVKMAEMNITDESNKKTMFPRLIARRASSSNFKKDLISVFVEKGPSDGRSDYHFAASLDRIDIVLNLKLIQRVVSFLTFDHVNFNHLEKVAKKQLEKAKKWTKKELKLALESRQAIDVQLQIKAPTVLVPVSCDDPNSPFIFMDFGQFNLSSSLESKLQEEEKHDFHDRFIFKMSDIQIIIPENIPVLNFLQDYQRVQSGDPSADASFLNGVNLLEKVSVDVLLAKSIVPENTEIDRFTVTGQIPSIAFNVSPAKVDVCTKVISDIVAFVQNPSGASGTNAKMRGFLQVNGPMTKGSWEKSWVEVTATNKMILFDETEAQNTQLESDQKRATIAIINLNSRADIRASRTKENTFRVSLSQGKNRDPILIYFKCNSLEEQNQWISSLKFAISSFSKNFLMGNIAKGLMKDARDEIKQGMGILVAESSNQVLVGANFMLSKFTVNFQKQSPLSPRSRGKTELASIIFNDLSSNFKHRSYDTILDMHLQSLVIRDMITSSSGEQYILYSDEDVNSNKLVDIRVQRASHLSEYYVPDALVLFSAKFGRVQAFAEPEVLSEFIQFGYDLTDIFDEAVDSRVQVYSAKADDNAITKFIEKELQDINVEDIIEIQETKHRSILKVSANTSDISLLVLNKGIEFTKLSMSRSLITVDVNTQLLTFSGNVGNLIVTDLLNKDTAYPEILGLGSKNEGSLVDFKFTFNFKQSDLVSYRSSLYAKMQAVRYVHIHRYVSQLVDYIRGPVNEALSREFNRKRSLSDAHTDVEHRRRRVATKGRVKIDVTMISPIILLPSSYKSYDYILGNLGNLTINSFLDQSGDTLLDDLTFSLQDMHLTTVHGQNSKSQHVVDNVTISVNVKTALLNPNNVIPDTAFRIDIGQVNFKLAQNQYQLIFDVVNSNIKDGLRLKQDKQLLEKMGSLAVKNKLLTQDKLLNNFAKIVNISDSDYEQTNVAEEFGLYDSDEEELPIHQSLIVDVIAPQMVVSLLRGDGKAKDGLDNPIVELTISQLEVRTGLKTDDSVEVTAALDYIQAVDKRSETANQFRTIFDSRRMDSTKCITFSFHHLPAQKRTAIRLDLSDPKAVFVPDVVLEFKNFFTHTKYSGTEAPAADSQDNKATHQDDLNDVSSRSDSKKRTKKKAEHSFEFYAQFGKPEIVFPEDSSDANCKLIVLESAFKCYFVHRPDVEDGTFDISGATAYIKQNGSDPTSEAIAIVEPIYIDCCLTADLKAEIPKRQISIELKQGGSTRISYQDIKMVIGILRRFNEQPDLTKSPSLSAISDSGKEEAEEFELAVDPSPSESTLDEIQNALKSIDFERFKAELDLQFKSVNDFAILIVDDMQGYDLPLADVHLSDADFNFNITLVNNRVSSASAFTFRAFANYYNFKFAEWEPILEKNTEPFQLLFQRKPSEQDPAKDINSLEIRSRSAINANVTQQMLENAVHTGRRWITGFNDPNKPVAYKFEPFSIQNLTGLKASFSKHENMDKAVDLDREEVKFGFSNFRTKNFKNVQHFVYIDIEGTVQKILVNKDQKYFFKVQGYSVCIEIKLLESRKAILIHSGCSIVNNTSRTWHIGAYVGDDTAPTSISVLKPRDNTFIPCHVLATGTMTVRPEDEDYAWSTKKKEYHFDKLKAGINLLPHCRNTLKQKVYCVLHASKLTDPNQIDCTVSIMAPIALENTLGVEANFVMMTKGRSDPNKMNAVWSQALKRGEKIYIYSVNIRRNLWLQTTLLQNNVTWKTSDVSLISSPKTDIPLDTSFVNVDQLGRELLLKLDYCYTANSYHEICVYCSYWIINHTGLKLQPRVGEVDAPGPNLKVVTNANTTDPLMFDYRTGNYIFANKINVKVNDTLISQPFSIDSVGEVNDVEVENSTHKYPIGMSIAIGSGKFKRTKMITFTPKFIVVNKTDSEMNFKQFGSTTEFQVSQNDTKSFFWTEKKLIAQMLSMKLDYTDWSVPFRIDNTGEVSLILKHTKKIASKPRKKKTYVTVQMHSEMSIVYVVFELAQYPPYYIYNKTKHDLILGQHGVSGLFSLKANSKAPFSWPDQTRNHTMVVHIEQKYSATFDADIVSNKKSITMKELNKAVVASVTAQGYTRVLQFTEEEISNTEKKETQTSDTSATDEQTPIWLAIDLNLKGIGLSVSDDRPEELVYALLDDIRCKFNMTENRQFFEAKVARLQINNQTLKPVYPVIMTNSKKLEVGKEFIHLSMIRSHHETTYDSIPYFSFLMQEADVSFDFRFVNRMYNVTNNIVETLFTQHESTDTIGDLVMNRDELEESKTVLTDKYTTTKHKKMYFELMQLHPIKLNFSFLFNTPEATTLNSSTDDLTPSRSKENPTLLILQTIGAHLNANIDQAPIRLNALILQHPFLTREALAESVMQHYKKYAIAELYKLLGSFSSIGNPIGLFNGLIKISSFF